VNNAVLDASALIALILREPGSERLTPRLMSAAITSAVNLAEVHGKLLRSGFSSDDAWTAANEPIKEVVPFSAEQAKTAGDLTLQTRALGLSLGDRACLALALSMNAPVYTTDRSWGKLDLGIRIYSLR
jgi:PIN domain nuclease of toxin-antitoxin system